MTDTADSPTPVEDLLARAPIALCQAALDPKMSFNRAESGCSS
jgi:hypothetical protein